MYPRDILTNDSSTNGEQGEKHHGANDDAIFAEYIHYDSNGKIPYPNKKDIIKFNKFCISYILVNGQIKTRMTRDVQLNEWDRKKLFGNKNRNIVSVLSIHPFDIPFYKSETINGSDEIPLLEVGCNISLKYEPFDNNSIQDWEKDAVQSLIDIAKYESRMPYYGSKNLKVNHITVKMIKDDYEEDVSSMINNYIKASQMDYSILPARKLTPKWFVESKDWETNYLMRYLRFSSIPSLTIKNAFEFNSKNDRKFVEMIFIRKRIEKTIRSVERNSNTEDSNDIGRKESIQNLNNAKMALYDLRESVKSLDKGENYQKITIIMKSLEDTIQYLSTMNH